MTDRTIEPLNDAVNNTHISQDTTKNEQHGTNYLKNKKKRDKAKLKKQQETDTEHNGNHSATNGNNSTNNENTDNKNTDLESSLLLMTTLNTTVNHSHLHTPHNTIVQHCPTPPYNPVPYCINVNRISVL